MDKHIRIIVQGKVQGVWFRDYTQKKANSLALKGTVRNHRDGTVEIRVYGSENQLKDLEQWCWEGSPYSNVTGVVVQELETSPEYLDFRVVY